MTIGPENHSTGTATAPDRFSSGVSAFRQSRREAALAAEGNEALAQRGTDMARSTDLNRSVDMSRSADMNLGPRSAQSLEHTGVIERATSLPSLPMQGLSEPVFHPNGWMEAAPATGAHTQAMLPATASTMADHPLLRGLLLELPPRGTLPAGEWLDRWFEAARSILELLYIQEAKKK